MNKNTIKLSSISQPKIETANRMTGLLGEHPVAVERHVDGFSVCLRITVNDIIIHDFDFSEEEKTEWTYLADRAFVALNDGSRSRKMAAVAIAKKHGMFPNSDPIK